MSQDYSPSLVTKNLVFCGDAAMKSAAGPATLLYDKVNDNNGTMYNGSCIDFDGTDDFVSIADDSTLDITGDMTVSCWVALDSAENGNLCILVNKRDNSDSTNPFLVYFEDRAGEDSFKFSMGEGSSSEQIGSDDNFDGVYDKWDHVVATISGTTMSLYVNGVLDTTGTFSGSRQTNNMPIRLGASYTNGSYDYPMAGQMADVRVYSAALSAANVKELYDDSKLIIPTKNDASGGFVAQTNLMGWWPLAEGAGALCYDGSGNGNTGTITNGEDDEWLTGQTGAPQLVEGYNRPMLFDGSSDYVTLSSASVAGASAGTVSTWIYMTGAAVDHATIYTCQVGPNWIDMRLTLNISVPNRIRLHLSNGSAAIYSALLSSILNYNQWYHVAATYDGTTAKIYIDGSLDASLTTAVTPGSFTPGFTGIGWMASGARYFPGIINEVAVYDSDLTLAQVGVLAATGPNGGPLPPNPSTTNLIGYWRNDGNVTWTDRSGNGNNGTVTGSPDALLFKQGINGSKNVNTGRDGQGFPLLYQNNGAIGFNGTDATGDYIDCGDLGTIGDEFTYSVWFKTGPSTAATYRMFMCVDGNTNGNPQIRIYNGNVQMRFYSDNSLASSGTYWDGEWHQAVGGINGSGDYFLYVDGVSQGTLTPISYTVSWSGNTRIGKYNYAGGKFFEGQIANAQIYDRALTYAEIQQNYNSFKTRFGK